MKKEEVFNEITNRINLYIQKTKNFNNKKTIVICEIHEVQEIKKFFYNNQLRIDVLEIYINNKTLLHQFSLWNNDAHYFISKKIMSDELYELIEMSEINKDNIYIGPTSHGYFDLYEKRENIIKNIDKITEVINFLSDEKSKNIFFNVLVRLSVPYQFHFYYEKEDFPQYFCNDFEYRDNELFLDAGVYNGVNIFEFCNKVNWKYSKIIALEADTNNYIISKENLESVNSIFLIKKALYNYDGIIKFLSTNKSSKKSNSRVGEDGDIEVNCIKGDSLEEPFSFIKMDIEGSEKEALDGLNKTIKKYSPKLAICIYHFQSDFWEVPLKIKEIDPTYNLKIRNHKKLNNLTETVVYAWK